jgi:hypothetical protein
MIRADQTRVAKIIFEIKSESRMKVARARLRWVEVVENDLREPNGGRSRENTNNREGMACVMKEANVLGVHS